MSNDDTKVPTDLEIQSKISREKSRIYKFYQASKPYRGGKPKISLSESVVELTKFRATLLHAESIAFCDEALERLDLQLKEGESNGS